MLIWGLVLLGLAILLVFVEVFIPSGGVISMASAVCAIAGVVCLFKVNWQWGVAGIAAVVMLAPLAFMFALNLMPSTPLGRKILFGEEGKDAAETIARQDAHPYAALVGAEGVALTDLRPVGTVRIEGQKLDALTELMMIEKGTRVKVVSVEGTQIKVRPVA